MQDLPARESCNVPEFLSSGSHCFRSKGQNNDSSMLQNDWTFVDIDCVSVVHQGCPLGSAVFSATLHVSLTMIMSQHHRVQVFAYIDPCKESHCSTKDHCACMWIRISSLNAADTKHDFRCKTTSTSNRNVFGIHTCC